jgi:hypothetical protein
MRKPWAYSLCTLLLIGCSDGGGNDSDALLVALLLGAPQEQTTIAGDAPVPIPPSLPAPPGQPLNAPILLAPTVLTFDVQALDALVRVRDVFFQAPVHDETIVMAFIGYSKMALLPDLTVINARKSWLLKAGQLPTSPHLHDFRGSGFEFADHRVKLLLVARNEFGVSSLEIPVRHARRCVGTIATPVVVGDCAGHCVQASLPDPTTLRVTAKKTTVDGMTYAYNELFVTKFTIDGEDVHYSLTEYFTPPNGIDPLPAGAYEATIDINDENDNLMCYYVSSYAVAMEPFELTFLNTLFAIP